MVRFASSNASHDAPINITNVMPQRDEAVTLESFLKESFPDLHAKIISLYNDVNDLFSGDEDDANDDGEKEEIQEEYRTRPHRPTLVPLQDEDPFDVLRGDAPQGRFSKVKGVNIRQAHFHSSLQRTESEQLLFGEADVTLTDFDLLSLGFVPTAPEYQWDRMWWGGNYPRRKRNHYSPNTAVEKSSPKSNTRPKKQPITSLKTINEDREHDATPATESKVVFNLDNGFSAAHQSTISQQQADDAPQNKHNAVTAPVPIQSLHASSSAPELSALSGGKIAMNFDLLSDDIIRLVTTPDATELGITKPSIATVVNQPSPRPPSAEAISSAITFTPIKQLHSYKQPVKFNGETPLKSSSLTSIIKSSPETSSTGNQPKSLELDLAVRQSQDLIDAVLSALEPTLDADNTLRDNKPPSGNSESESDIKAKRRVLPATPRQKTVENEPVPSGASAGATSGQMQKSTLPVPSSSIVRSASRNSNNAGELREEFGDDNPFVGDILGSRRQSTADDLNVSEADISALLSLDFNASAQKSPHRASLPGNTATLAITPPPPNAQITPESSQKPP